MASRAGGIDLLTADRREILTLGENLPQLLARSDKLAPPDRKQIIRLVVKEVILDQKRRRGYVWIRIIWQTGAASEHWVQRRVQGYAQHADQDRLRERIAELNRLKKLDAEIAAILNREEFLTAHGPPFSGKMIHLLQNQPRFQPSRSTVAQQTRRNGPTEATRCQRTAAMIGITPQTIFDWLPKGSVTGQSTPQGYAMANLAIPRSGRGAPSTRPTYRSPEASWKTVNSPNTVPHSPTARLEVSSMAAALVAPADQLEEQVRRVRFERQVAQFVDDQQLGLGVVRQPLLQPALGMRLGQCATKRRRRCEQHRVAGEDRLAAERHGEVRLADPGRPQQQHRLAVGDQAAGGELADLRLVDRRLGSEVEAVQIAHGREARQPKAISMRRWSRRAISRSHNSASASRMVSSCRPASSSRLSSWSRMAVSFSRFSMASAWSWLGHQQPPPIAASYSASGRSNAGGASGAWRPARVEADRPGLRPGDARQVRSIGRRGRAAPSVRHARRPRARRAARAPTPAPTVTRTRSPISRHGTV